VEKRKNSRKQLLSVLLISLVPTGAHAEAARAAVVFVSPTFAKPHFQIAISHTVMENKTVLKELRVNGEKQPRVLVFRDGRNFSAGTALEKGTYEVVADYAWKSGKNYRLTIISQIEGRTPEIREITGRAPDEGGIPGGKEGFYRVYAVEEEAGLARDAETVSLILTAPKNEAEEGTFVVFDGSSPVPYEIIERRESVPPEKASADHPVTLTFKIVFQLSARAGEKKLLLVLKDEKHPTVKPGIQLVGEGLGKTVDNGMIVLGLSPQSGQVNTITSPPLNLVLQNRAGVIHWNPDVFIPGIAWDHSFDWNPPPIFEEKCASLMYVNSRRGPLPRIQDVHLDVRYTLEAGKPYFLSETRLNFLRDLGVIAVRNDEMVLSKELFDSLVYKDRYGKIIKLELREKPGVPFGLVHAGPSDLEWVGLVNTKEKYGFFSLRLNSACGNFESPGEFEHKAGTYFYAPADGNYVYWVRPLIYTWADFATNTLLVSVPKGSFFYEKNAYLVLRLDEDFEPRLDEWHRRLTRPLRVF